jgi:xyloglucan 6-xylosyltransferase
MSHPHRALAEHHDARSRASTTTTSSSSSSARRDDDPDPPPRSLRDPPYTLGPKIFDWDEQRTVWHRRHLETPPFLNDIKPRVLLVTTIYVVSGPIVSL